MVTKAGRQMRHGERQCEPAYFLVPHSDSKTGGGEVGEMSC